MGVRANQGRGPPLAPGAQRCDPALAAGPGGAADSASAPCPCWPSSLHALPKRPATTTWAVTSTFTSTFLTCSVLAARRPCPGLKSPPQTGPFSHQQATSSARDAHPSLSGFLFQEARSDLRLCQGQAGRSRPGDRGLRAEPAAGAQGFRPAFNLAFDLHSTMGTCLITEAAHNVSVMPLGYHLQVALPPGGQREGGPGAGTPASGRAAGRPFHQDEDPVTEVLDFIELLNQAESCGDFGETEAQRGEGLAQGPRSQNRGQSGLPAYTEAGDPAGTAHPQLPPLQPSMAVFQMFSDEDVLYEGESTVYPVFIMRPPTMRGALSSSRLRSSHSLCLGGPALRPRAASVAGPSAPLPGPSISPRPQLPRGLLLLSSKMRRTRVPPAETRCLAPVENQDVSDRSEGRTVLQNGAAPLIGPGDPE
ncbi:hypothetical protein GH733_007708 [Mirounga leonina]|nr:hypothetical protein GH733_007708 [Mirounga leonina]